MIAELGINCTKLEVIAGQPVFALVFFFEQSRVTVNVLSFFSIVEVEY